MDRERLQKSYFAWHKYCINKTMLNWIYYFMQYVFKNTDNVLKIPIYIIKFILYKIIVYPRKKIICMNIFNEKKILIFPTNSSTKAFIYTDYADKKEIDILRDQCTGSTVFLDIGANVGTYSIMLCDKINKLYAFEPHPTTNMMCKANLLINKISEKNVYDVALFDKEGRESFSDKDFESGASGSNSITTDNSKITVETMTLDKFSKDHSFNIEHEYIVKIDVEGFERNVLLGGKHFFSKFNVKAIIFESSPQTHKGILDILSSYNYSVTDLNRNNFLAIKNKSN